MRYDTAVDRLHKIADACSDVSRFRDELTAAYVYGDLLAGADVEVVQVALAVDVPPEELPWRTEPTELRALAQVLRLDRAPVSWTWRPARGPVALHEIDGPVRFWTRDSGTDDEVLRHLREKRFDRLPRERVDADDAGQQLAGDRDHALRHLRQVTELYWDAEWRRDHKGSGMYPEDHLWRAVQGYLDLLDASQQ